MVIARAATGYSRIWISVASGTRSSLMSRYSVESLSVTVNNYKFAKYSTQTLFKLRLPGEGLLLTAGIHVDDAVSTLL